MRRIGADVDEESLEPTESNPEWLEQQRAVWAEQGVGIKPDVKSGPDSLGDDFAIVGDEEDSMIARLVDGAARLLGRKK